MVNMHLGVTTFDASNISNLQHLRLASPTHLQYLQLTSTTSDSPPTPPTHLQCLQLTSNTSNSPPTPPTIMINQERKLEAREKCKAERKEKHKEIKIPKKAAKTSIEYSSTSQQIGKDVTFFALIHRDHDDEYAQQLLVNQTVLTMDDPTFHTYYSINTPSTFFVLNKEARKVVFGVRCTPVIHLAEVEKFDEFFKHIHQDSQLHSQMKTNRAFLIGAMWVMGWRAGYKRGIAFDIYLYPKMVKRKRVGSPVVQRSWNPFFLRLLLFLYGIRLLFNNSTAYSSYGSTSLRSTPHSGKRFGHARLLLCF